MNYETEEQFTPASHDFHKHTSLEQRKKLGQYMTPSLVSKHLVSELDIQPNERVLDPAVGTGELLFHALLSQPDAYYEGWDVDKHVLDYARQNLPSGIPLESKSALEALPLEKWDVIIANPPYFEMKLNDAQKAYFAPVMGGRPNIFTLFFYQAMCLLKEGGRLGFIVPPSMNNGAFFLNLRRFLIKQGHIKHIKIFTDAKLFHGAQIAAQAIIIEKGKMRKEQPFVFHREDKPFFVEDKESILSFWEGKSSLHDLGYKVITGPIVWNRYKGQFASSEGSIPIVYASDIGVDGKLSWDSRNEYRRYIAKQSRLPVSKRAIVVNRVTRGLGSRSLRAALVNKEFYGENHINVILPRSGLTPLVSMDELLRKIQSVDTRYITAFTGSAQISTRELEYLIPL